MEILHTLLILTIFVMFPRSRSFPVSGATFDYPVGQVFTYLYNTEVAINEPDAKQRKTMTSNDVGLKFKATLELSCVWQKGDDLLFKLMVTKPRFDSVARAHIGRDLSSVSRFPLYFRLENGHVRRIFRSTEDTELSVNVKKGIVALFQLQDKDVERTEVDLSGECTANYHVTMNKVKKTKRSCHNRNTDGEHFNPNQLLSNNQTSSHSILYAFKDDIIESVSSTESHVTRLNLRQTIGAVISTSQDLSLKGKSGKTESVNGADVQEAIKKINKKARSSFNGDSLVTVHQSQSCGGEECLKLDELIKRDQELYLPDRATTKEAAESFIRLVRVLRRSSSEQISGLLRNDKFSNIIGTLIDAATASQTTESQTALLATLDFTHATEISHAERYLLGVAFATHPTESLLSDLLRIFQKKIPNASLRESVGSAMSGALYTFCLSRDPCHAPIVVEIKEALLKRLDACSKTDVQCQATILRALANAGLPNTLPTLLRYAEESSSNWVSEAAISALRRMPGSSINQTVLDTMLRIYERLHRNYDSAVRSKAFSVILEHHPSVSVIGRLLRFTSEPRQNEFASYIQARLFNKAVDDSSFGEKLKQALKENQDLNNYHVLAPKGKSLAFKGILAETDSVVSKYDMMVETSPAGIIKRSGLLVDLQDRNSDSKADTSSSALQMYSFNIFAAGIESLLGEEVEAGQENAQATAGIQLDLMGVATRPFTFFEGQAGLMAAVWSAPSEPITALQHLLLLNDHAERIHLQNGLVAELDVMSAVAIELSGSISISLWNKNAHTLIKNTGALSLSGSIRLDTPSFHTGVQFGGEASSVINFQSDVDFYDGVKSCLQMSRPSFTFQQNVRKFERAFGIRNAYIARIKRSFVVPAVSYPLPTLNNRMCRLMADKL